MTENQTTIRNIWKEGGRTYCISIPIDIVKKLNLDEKNTLLVELVDNLIVLKKHESHLTKTEISKVRDFKITSNNSETYPTQQIKDNSSNPLDGYEF